jgi:hypothetical protein
MCGVEVGVNEGDQGEDIWLIDFIYLYEIEQATVLSGVRRGLRRRDNGGELTNVQYKLIWNCHYEFPPRKTNTS